MSWRSRASRAPGGRRSPRSTRSIACGRASGCCRTSRELAARHAFLALVPVSALKADNVAGPVRQAIAAHLPVAPAVFPDGELTDRSLTSASPR